MSQPTPGDLARCRYQERRLRELANSALKGLDGLGEVGHVPATLVALRYCRGVAGVGVPGGTGGDGVTDFPPLTSTAVYPLHGWNYGAEYACRRPEDPDCRVFDWRCRRCVLAAQAVLANCGDETVYWRRNGVAPEQPVPLSWLVDRSLYWLSREAL